jgi:hypothetical protein
VILWSTINSVAIALLAGFLYLIVRQIGFILSKLGPTGARGMEQGPRVGENISPFTAFADRDLAPTATLYIFASTYCPVCKTVREAAKVIAHHWRSAAGVVMIYETSAGPAAAAALEADGSLWIARRAGLREQLDIRTVPYAVMTDAAGVVTGHGLVNNASHLESLLEQWQASRPEAGAPLEKVLQTAGG